MALIVHLRKMIGLPQAKVMSVYFSWCVVLVTVVGSVELVNALTLWDPETL